jgi:hypothetical protein
MKEIMEITLTRHARLRMAQRNVSVAQIWFILGHGHRCHRAGVFLLFPFLAQPSFIL